MERGVRVTGGGGSNAAIAWLTANALSMICPNVAQAREVIGVSRPPPSCTARPHEASPPTTTADANNLFTRTMGMLLWTYWKVAGDGDPSLRNGPVPIAADACAHRPDPVNVRAIDVIATDPLPRGVRVYHGHRSGGPPLQRRDPSRRPEIIGTDNRSNASIAHDEEPFLVSRDPGQANGL